MMTIFRILIDTAGLSLVQASAFLDAREDSVMSWSSGRRPTPPGVITELHELIAHQQLAARQSAAHIEKIMNDNGTPEVIEIGVSADDHEAQSLGWPTVSAHAAVIGMSVALLPAEIVARVSIVPRGSTAATAKAADAH